MSALTDYFTSLANKIRSKTGKVATLTPSDMVDEIDDVYSAGVNDTFAAAQAKSATATTSAQTISPDTGKLLKSVTVNPQQHSATYTFSSGNGATVDLGTAHNYRNVNASNVYSYGWAQAIAGLAVRQPTGVGYAFPGGSSGGNKSSGTLTAANNGIAIGFVTINGTSFSLPNPAPSMVLNGSYKSASYVVNESEGRAYTYVFFQKITKGQSVYVTTRGNIPAPSSTVSGTLNCYIVY